MSQVIKRRSYETVRHYVIRWSRPDSSGYEFPCQPDGTIDEVALQPGVRASLTFCRDGLDPTLAYEGVCSWDEEIKHPTIIRCNCGVELHLYSPITNKCDCGQFYNGSGQELCHPRFWGEETGERFDDEGNYVSGGDY